MTNKHYKPLLIESVKANADLIEHRFVGFNGKHCEAGAKAFGVIDVSTEKNSLHLLPYLVFYLWKQVGQLHWVILLHRILMAKRSKLNRPH